jgi:hypothetical protein
MKSDRELINLCEGWSGKNFEEGSYYSTLVNLLSSLEELKTIMDSLDDGTSPTVNIKFVNSVAYRLQQIIDKVDESL